MDKFFVQKSFEASSIRIQIFLNFFSSHSVESTFKSHDLNVIPFSNRKISDSEPVFLDV